MEDGLMVTVNSDPGYSRPSLVFMAEITFVQGVLVCLSDVTLITSSSLI